MKKTLPLFAVSMVAAGATAAQVEIYGIVDLGLVYTHEESSGFVDANGSIDNLSMNSGQHSGSRFGFRGREDLGEGWAVSFSLENGFSADSGSLMQGGRLFGREALLSLESPYGTLSMGRTGALTGGAGSYDIFMSRVDTMEACWDGIFGCGNWHNQMGRVDNAVIYKTPDYAGLTGYAMYSFGTDAKNDWDDDVSNPRDTRRYFGAGVTYDNGPLSVAAVYETYMHSHKRPYWDLGDSQVFSLGVSYDFTAVKLFVAGQYMKDTRATEDEFIFGTYCWVGDNNETLEVSADGYALHVGVAIPTANFGTFRLAAYYADLDMNGFDSDAKNYNFIVANEYMLSKRTMIYSGLAYKQVESDDSVSTAKVKTTQATVGLLHRF